MFGIGSMEELTVLPKYKLDENEQIVLEEFQNRPNEAPMPGREDLEEEQEEIKEEE